MIFLYLKTYQLFCNNQYFSSDIIMLEIQKIVQSKTELQIKEAVTTLQDLYNTDIDLTDWKGAHLASL